MTDKTQPEALRLANEFKLCNEYDSIPSITDIAKAEAELRRQHARIAELEAELEAVGAGGVQALSAAPAGFVPVAAFDRLHAHAESLAARLLATSPTHPAEQQAAHKAAPGEPTQEFEKWLATYSTLPAARDVNGYADLTTEMLWHAWQAAAKTKAPEGASAEWIDANARPGLALTNYACAHAFSVQPSSGIRLCQKCGISETAARKAAPQQEAQEPVGEVQHLHELNDSWLNKLPIGTKLYTAPRPAPAPLSDDAERLREALQRIEGASMSMYATRSDMLEHCQDIARAALAAQGGRDAG